MVELNSTHTATAEEGRESRQRMRIDRYVHDERLTWGAAGVLSVVTALHAAGIGRLFVTPPEAPDPTPRSPVFQVSLERLPPPSLPRELVERPTEPSTSTDTVKQRPRMTRPVPILVDTPTTDPVPPDTQVKPYEIGDELLPGEALNQATSAAIECQVFFSIGTSSTVEPAASLAYLALENGVIIIEINPMPTKLTPTANFFLPGPSGEILPVLVAVLTHKN